MAEIAIKIAINKLIQQVNVLSGVHDDAVCIRSELEMISAFLKDADARGARSNPNEITRAWMKQLRQVAHRIEDAIDRYIHHEARSQQRKRSIRFYHQTKRVLKLKSQHDLATEIGDIKTTLKNILARHQYTLILDQQGGISRSHSKDDDRIGAPFTDKAQLVGIEAHMVKLERWLEDGGAKQKVIALVGMGGSGKTTLAKQVYDNLRTDEFTCRAWIPVSQSYTLEQLLRTMIKQFCESCRNPTPQGIDSMDGRELIEELREYTKQRRYVAVFDDVWDNEFWVRHIKIALPENNQQSRILITTRRQDVAPSNCVYELQPLTFKHAWELFCKMVFHSLDEGQCPPELEELSKSIVTMCEGLPLAIVTLGLHLSKNHSSFSEFLVVHTMIDKHLARVSKILSLSYDDLPLHLKSCLLSFGLFPKGCSIRGSRLICQWIAEGFIEGMVSKSVSFEDLAESYLKELTCRSLIQVSEIDNSGKAKKYRVCDLMHNLLLSKVYELNFCVVLEENVSINLDGDSRRLSIMTNPKNLLNASTNASAIRCVFCFEVLEFPEHFATKLFKHFKLLTMLDLENAPLDYIPETIGNLFNLKYFSVRNTRVKNLPESIGKLQQLETLDTKQSLVQELPVQARRLHKLRNLLAYHCNRKANDFSLTDTGVKIPQGLGCKETLQKLSLVELDETGGVTKDLENFMQLKKLGVIKVRGEHGKDLCSAIQTKKKLRSLKIILLNDQEIVDLQSLHTDHHPPLLQHLYLKGRLVMLPDWISRLQSLVRLRLHWCGLNDNPLLVLQGLPNLLELTISNNAYTGEELQFQTGFRKLKVLRLEYLDALKKLTLSGSSLQDLEMVIFLSCIQYLTNLEYLHFYDMPEEFCMSMVPEPNEGLNYSMVRGIQTVKLSFICGPNQYETFSLQDYGPIAHNN